MRVCVVTLPCVKSIGHHFEASPAFCSVANKLISSETKERRMRMPEFNRRVFVLLLTIKFGGKVHLGLSGFVSHPSINILEDISHTDVLLALCLLVL